MNIKQVLEYGMDILNKNNIQNPIFKARILLANVLKQNKEYLITHDIDELQKKQLEEYKNNLNKLIQNIPMQYIIGKQEFMGLEFEVNENVLIPRQDTEILVEEVINIVRREKKIKILDLCTGSGAIGISLARYLENTKVILSDISIKALEIVKINSIKNKADKNIEVIQSDLFDNIDKNNKFDIIVSNPPYIKSEVIDTLDEQVKKEPFIALDGGTDGLKIYKRIIDEAFKYLNRDGYLCLEIGYDQKQEIIDLIKNTNRYKDIYSKKDLSNNDRIVICKKGDN